MAWGKNFFVEPYLGYGQSTFSQGDVEDTDTAAVLGGKGGLFLRRIVLGLDYHTGGVYEMKESNLDLTNTMFGVGFGHRFSKGRWWVGYYPQSAIEDPNKFVEFKGTSLKFSLGFTFKSKLSVNVEYIQHDVKLEEAGLLSVTSPESVKSSVLFMSISAPILF